MTSAAPVDVADLIDRRPMGARQWLLLALCTLVVVADGMDTAVLGFLAPAIGDEWGGTRAGFGLVMGAAPIGLVLGALVAGPLSDRAGRKAVLVASVGLFGLFTIATATARTPAEMAAWRLLTGLGLGAAMPNATTLLSEYVPSRRRALWVAVMFTGFNLGAGLIGFLAAALIPSHGWRSVLVAGGALPLALAPLLVALLPESARFLIVRGEPAGRVGAVLGRVLRTNFAPGTRFFAPEPPLPAKKPIGVLFAPGYAVTTAALWLTYFMGLLVIYLLTGWLPTLVKAAGLPIAEAARVTALFQIGGPAGAIGVGLAMGRARPTRVIALAYALAAAGLVALGVAGAASADLPLVAFGVGFFLFGAQTGMNGYAPGCYPTKARATGVSWMFGMGRLGSIVGSAIGGVLMTRGWGFGAIVSLLALPALVAGLSMLTAARRQRGDLPDGDMPRRLLGG